MTGKVLKSNESTNAPQYWNGTAWVDIKEVRSDTVRTIVYISQAAWNALPIPRDSTILYVIV